MMLTSEGYRSVADHASQAHGSHPLILCPPCTRPCWPTRLTTTLLHGLSLLQGDVRLASIDHVMCFHRDFRIGNWLLYQVDSPTVSGSQALCRGAVYSRDGRLVASTPQEGLVRTRRNG